jgi:hypothetical protein
MFLGRTKDKLECAGCHGPRAEGNGPSFIDRRIFDLVVFGGDVTPPGAWQSEEVQKRLEWAISKRYRELEDIEKSKAHTGHQTEAEMEFPGVAHGPTEPPASTLEEFKTYRDKALTTWKDGSFDEWGQPLRPANLNLGLYKGGRRPLDIYWRIAKGINGAKMPGHGSAMPPEQIWDIVNFVLALPYQPELLRDYHPAPLPPAAVAHR